MAFEGITQFIKEIKAIVTTGLMHCSKCKSTSCPLKKGPLSPYAHVNRIFLRGLRHGKTTEAESAIQNYTPFVNQERSFSLTWSLHLRGKWLFHQFNGHCFLVFIYDWSWHVTCINYWKTICNDQNNHGWECSGWAVQQEVTMWQLLRLGNSANCFLL